MELHDVGEQADGAVELVCELELDDVLHDVGELGDAEVLVCDVEEELVEHFHDELEQLDDDHDVEDYDAACDVADDVHDVVGWELQDVLLDKRFHGVEELYGYSDDVVAAVLDSGGDLVDDIEVHGVEELNELLRSVVMQEGVELRDVLSCTHDVDQHNAIQHDLVQHDEVQRDVVQYDADQHIVVDRDADQHNAVPHDVAQLDAALHDVVQYGEVLHDEVLHKGQHGAALHNAALLLLASLISSPNLVLLFLCKFPLHAHWEFQCGPDPQHNSSQYDDDHSRVHRAQLDQLFSFHKLSTSSAVQVSRSPKSTFEILSSRHIQQERPSSDPYHQHQDRNCRIYYSRKCDD